MKVAVFVKATKSSETGQMPSQQLLIDMGKFNEALVNAGIMKAGEGLKPSKEGVRIRFRVLNRTVTDGPFTETNELVAGYWIWEVASMQEAIEWVKKCPNPMEEESDIEIRPIYGIEDFAELDPTGELRAEEEALASRITSMSDDESAIRRAMARWSAALEAKDADAWWLTMLLMRCCTMRFHPTKRLVPRTFAICGNIAALFSAQDQVRAS